MLEKEILKLVNELGDVGRKHFFLIVVTLHYFCLHSPFSFSRLRSASPCMHATIRNKQPQSLPVHHQQMHNTHEWLIPSHGYGCNQETDQRSTIVIQPKPMVLGMDYSGAVVVGLFMCCNQPGIGIGGISAWFMALAIALF